MVTVGWEKTWDSRQKETIPVPIAINDGDALKQYIEAIMARAEHHGPNVSAIALALAGAVIWRKVRSRVDLWRIGVGINRLDPPLPILALDENHGADSRYIGNRPRKKATMVPPKCFVLDKAPVLNRAPLSPSTRRRIQSACLWTNFLPSARP